MKQRIKDDDKLNTTAAGEFIGGPKPVPPVTMSSWRRRNIGPPYRKVGKLVVYEVADLKAWMAAHKRDPENVRGGA